MHYKRLLFFFLSLFIIPLSSLWADKSLILVYEGSGTSDDLVAETITGFNNTIDPENYVVISVTAEKLRDVLLNGESSIPIAAIVFPGGTSSRAYQTAMGEDGMRAIVAYVKNGGCYIGFCAGAYLFSRERLFYCADGSWLNVINSEDSFLWNGTAYGPALSSYSGASSCNSARAATIQLTLETEAPSTHLYWNGGPIFPLSSIDDRSILAIYEDPLYEPVATRIGSSSAPSNTSTPASSSSSSSSNVPGYESLPYIPAAIISGTYGSGRYLLSGVHPELFTQPLTSSLHHISGYFHHFTHPTSSSSAPCISSLSGLARLGMIALRTAPRSALCFALILQSIGMRTINQRVSQEDPLPLLYPNPQSY